MNYKFIIGVILILYGIFKIIFSIYELRPAKTQEEKHTFADNLLIIILLIFGIYSLLHGIAMLFHTSMFGQMVDNVNTFGVIYMIFGIIMIEVYSIIVYTNIPIPKNENKMEKYKLIGIGGGITFILALLMKLVWYKYFNKDLGYWNFSLNVLLYWTILLSFIFMIYFWNSYFVTKKELGTNMALLGSIAMNSV